MNAASRLLENGSARSSSDMQRSWIAIVRAFCFGVWRACASDRSLVCAVRACACPRFSCTCFWDVQTGDFRTSCERWIVLYDGKFDREQNSDTDATRAKSLTARQHEDSGKHEEIRDRATSSRRSTRNRRQSRCRCSRASAPTRSPRRLQRRLPCSRKRRIPTQRRRCRQPSPI